MSQFAGSTFGAVITVEVMAFFSSLLSDPAIDMKVTGK
jgi:hypothetical protein